MNKTILILVGLAVAGGVGFFLWKSGMFSGGSTAKAAPVPVAQDHTTAYLNAASSLLHDVFGTN